MPLELEISTLRIALRGLIDDENYKEQRLHKLEMLDEQCINALEHLQAYCKRRQHIYNHNVIPHTFSKYDLVLSENQHNVNANPNEKEKFSPNW